MNPSAAATLRHSLIGLEKETLRVDPEGRIAQTDHPRGLGSALTHASITTDYSEALLELITRPWDSLDEVMAELGELHQFVVRQLGHELLWSCSMPGGLEDEESIRIAEYGCSNAGLMKHVYRRGLALRYGRKMQVIAGVHFNHSLPEAFWQQLQRIDGDAGTVQAFRSAGYFSQLRNLQRNGWILLYLFGASPAVCESFFGKNEPIGLEYFGLNSYYQPYATSLRMGDIGYQNKKEGRTGVNIIYDDLDAYIQRLESAISTECPVYREKGVRVNGQYLQLNACQLQIENEYYSSARPKAILRGFEKPVRALRRAGVEYVELRSIDVNPLQPLGVDAAQLRFLQLFMLYNLLQDSPVVSAAERERNDTNSSRVAHRGREPGLRLLQADGEVALVDWAMQMLQEMQPLADVLDQIYGGEHYLASLQLQMEKVEHPQLTPSAQVLQIMTRNQQSFHSFALRQAELHKASLLQQPLQPERLQAQQEWAAASLQRQADMEQQDNVGFDEFLAAYFAQ